MAPVDKLLPIVYEGKVDYDKFRALVQSEFLKRKNKNNYFSLRAFSKYINVNKSSLSDFLTEKRNLSKKNVSQICQRLDLSPQQIRSLFVENSEYKDGQAKREKWQLTDDMFSLASSWYFYAILNLAKLPHHEADPKWISKKIEIDPQKAQLALDVLQRLRLIKIQDNQIFRIDCDLTTTTEVPSAAIRLFHRSMLEKGQEALEQCGIEERDFSSLTFVLDMKDLEKAKKMIVEWRRDFATHFTQKRSKACHSNRVCALNIQMFPLSL